MPDWEALATIRSMEFHEFSAEHWRRILNSWYTEVVYKKNVDSSELKSLFSATIESDKDLQEEFLCWVELHNRCNFDHTDILKFISHRIFEREEALQIARNIRALNRNMG